MAETFTDKLKLSKRDTGDLNWGQGANANLEALDAHIQQALLRPPRTLLATLGSGAVGANLVGNTSYFYKVTAVNDAGETIEGKIPSVVEAQVTQPATPLPVILQWETVKGATGYKIYKSSVSGQEKFLISVSGESTSTYTDDGNTATNPDVSVPILNTAYVSVSKIIPATGISITPSHGLGEVQVGNSGITGVRKLGEENPLAGDVKLEAGTGIALTQDAPNNKITIESSGGGGGNFIKITEETLSVDAIGFSVISGLDLSVDKAYKLLIDLSLEDAAATTQTIKLIFNGVTTGYSAQYISMGWGGSAVTNNAVSDPALSWVHVKSSGYPDSNIIEALIRKDGRGRIFALAQTIGNLNYSYYPNVNVGGLFWGGGTNVTSIEVKAGGTIKLKAGSRLTLYKIN